MKKAIIFISMLIPFAATAVENGQYNCVLTENGGGKYEWQITVTDETLTMFEDGETNVLQINPQGVWREDTDLSDGWNTKFKVERNMNQ